MSDTVKQIKSILERKATLEQNIAQCERGINHVNMTRRVTLYSHTSDQIYVDVSRDLIIEAVRKQVEIDKAELATIDKQLDAIGALMGANK